MGGERETERSRAPRAQCAVLLCAVHTAGRAAESGRGRGSGAGRARETDREGAYSILTSPRPAPARGPGRI
jgi:hypothetical protein